MSPKHCARLVQTVGWGFVVFSFIWVTSSFESMDGPGRLLIDILHWPKDGVPATPSMEARWMAGIGAGLTIGIGLMFVFIFAPLLRTGGTAAQVVRKGVILSLTGWFIVDGAASVAAGAPSNVVFNFIFYLMAVVPLLLVKFPTENV